MAVESGAAAELALYESEAAAAVLLAEANGAQPGQPPPVLLSQHLTAGGWTGGGWADEGERPNECKSVRHEWPLNRSHRLQHMHDGRASGGGWRVQEMQDTLETQDMLHHQPPHLPT